MMNAISRILAVSVGTAAVFGASAFAQTTAPENDNYLDSMVLDSHHVIGRKTIPIPLDTTAATVQSDLFAPPGSGGGPEPTQCGSRTYGRTVWFDLQVKEHGFLNTDASGFPAVIRLFEWNRKTNALGAPQDTCRSAPGNSQKRPFELKANQAYTIQVGGVDPGTGPAGGPLTFTYSFYGDRDQDGILDGSDNCPEVVGATADGCPPDVNAKIRPIIGQAVKNNMLAGWRVRTIRVKGAPGARAEIRCAEGCQLDKVKTVPTKGGLAFHGLKSLVLLNSVIYVTVSRPHSIATVTRITITDVDSPPKFKDLCRFPGRKPGPC